MHLSLLSMLDGTSLNVFDGILFVWLVIGLFRGRKNGMSVEFLYLIQWLLIIVVGAYAYRPVGDLMRQTFLFVSPLLAYISAYVLVGVIISAVISKIRRATETKLVSVNFFGKYEYYLGMTAGVLRFGCIALAFLALLNARIISKAEREETARIQRKNFESISFPTFGTIQQTVLFDSYSGKAARTYMENYLINSVPPDPNKPPVDTIAAKQQRVLDEITTPSKK